MTSAKIPRRLYHDDPVVDPDDYEYVLARKLPAESYEYLGCFKHDWSDSSLEYAFHGRDVTPEVGKHVCLFRFVRGFLVCSQQILVNDVCGLLSVLLQTFSNRCLVAAVYSSTRTATK